MIEIRNLLRYKLEYLLPDHPKGHIGIPTQVSYETLQYRHATFVGGENGWSEWKNVETVTDTNSMVPDLDDNYAGIGFSAVDCAQLMLGKKITGN